MIETLDTAKNATVLTRDGDGRVIISTDAEGHNTSMSYDVHDNENGGRTSTVHFSSFRSNSRISRSGASVPSMVLRTRD
ncbi:MAG: hypothetical protein GXX84_20905 [Acidobacteria bacterium]|nr:hypothetical protein [Acidobacteriota bacterium]